MAKPATQPETEDTPSADTIPTPLAASAPISMHSQEDVFPHAEAFKLAKDYISANYFREDDLHLRHNNHTLKDDGKLWINFTLTRTEKNKDGSSNKYAQTHQIRSNQPLKHIYSGIDEAVQKFNEF